MPLIRANRDSVDDRFSVLSFSVRTESPLFEVGIATDPALFATENRAHRNRRNFYSSRSIGAIRARRGEAVYLVPPDVLFNFLGAAKLYFGLATYREGSGGVPDFVQAPSPGHMYVNLNGLSERGLRRLVGSNNGTSNGSYGKTNGHDPSLDWGGDAQRVITASPIATTPTPTKNAATVKNGDVTGKSAAGQGPAPYDDGFGAFPSPNDATTREPAPAQSTSPQSAPTQSAAAQPARTAKAQAFRRPRALEDQDDGPGITGPMPDDDDVSQGLGLRALDAPAPEYPGASRFAPAAAGNYRAVSSPRTIDRVVIHITDGGSRIAGTIGWFQNPDQQINGKHITVSAHYVIGQDGEVVQMVRNNDIAWHASAVNGRSIGIEHVAYKRKPAANGRQAIPAMPPSEDQYQASAGLVAWLCSQFGIPVDRDHIVGHFEASPKDNHDCPSALWTWDHYMDLVRAASAGSGPGTAEPDATSEGLAFRKRAKARAQEIITPFYDPSDPSTALTCQNNAFSLAREEWFVGVDDTRSFPHSAICALTMIDPVGNVFGGTGFYIGQNRILTCAHNLAGMVTAQIVPGHNGDGSAPFGQCTVNAASWRVAPAYTGSGDWPHDLAVIDNVPLAAPNGRWFEFLNATPSDRLPIVVCGYSAQSDAVPELTQAIDGEKQHLHGGYAASQSDPEVIEYPILTLHGASGSPVYHIDDSSGDLKALVCAVHVTGQPAAKGLNRGCFITPNKIDWIEGRAKAFALDTPPAARARRGSNRRGRPSGVVAVRRSSRAQGLTDILPVDLKIRVFIPAPVAIVTIPGTDQPAPLQSGHGGDGRGFQLTGGSSRAEVTATFHFGDGSNPSQLTDLTRTFGESSNYDINDTVAVPGKPAWYRNIRDGATPIERGTQSVTDSKLNLEVGGSSFHGILSMAENAIVVTFNLHASDPIVTGAPDIDATLALLLKIDGERIKVRINGGHDEFPAYEIYANGTLVYSYDPVAAGGSPWGLFGDGNWDVNPDTSYVDVGPAHEYRMIPVHVQGTETAAPEYPVALIPQPDKQTSWMAAMAMLLRFRGNTNITPEALAQDLGTDDSTQALEAAQKRYGFVPIEVSSDPRQYISAPNWAKWLSENGPLWVLVTGLPHAVVVSGLRGSPAAPEQCEVKVLNPWDTQTTFDGDPTAFHPANAGSADWLPFEQFVADFANQAEPGYGNWKVLYLPVPAAAVPKAMAMTRVTTRPTPKTATARRSPPRSSARGLSGEATSDEAIEPSRVAGTTMRRVRGSQGQITWALDQLEGIKLPPGTAATTPALTPTTIVLSDWPHFGRDPNPLPLTVRFDAGGGAVGNIQVTAGTPAAVHYDVNVTATIEDDPQPTPTSSKASTAALRLTIDYDFSGTPEGETSARVKLRLLGNGNYDLACAWQ
jgi:V8-like Glu-specific endopeptidase